MTGHRGRRRKMKEQNVREHLTVGKQTFKLQILDRLFKETITENFQKWVKTQGMGSRTYIAPTLLDAWQPHCCTYIQHDKNFKKMSKGIQHIERNTDE